jgi:hypothetical protein
VLALAFLRASAETEVQVLHGRHTARKYYTPIHQRPGRPLELCVPARRND